MVRSEERCGHPPLSLWEGKWSKMANQVFMVVSFSTPFQVWVSALLGKGLEIGLASFCSFLSHKYVSSDFFIFT